MNRASSCVASLVIGVVVTALTGCGPTAQPGADARPADAGPAIDAGPAPDAIGPDLGGPCATQVDCPGGYCVAQPDGDVCTYPCGGACPLDWSCRVTDVGGSLVSVCLPEIVEVCSACTTDDQCAGGACIIIDGDGYCLRSCFEGACPDGYHCDDDPTGEHPGSFCLPDNGSCSCTPDSDGIIRTCSVSNAAGTCYGTQTCDPVGWGACTAPSATTEVCNGLDDDCDFLIDDGLDGDSCFNTNGFGSCPGTSVCTGAGGIICQGPSASAEICNYSNDDCDGNVDEGYPDLGDICQDGDGACLRFGVIRCTADGTGTDCSAVAGGPQPEACNAIDDNCSGQVDEDFTDLGDSCSTGVGICARDGQRICNGTGTGTTCSATAGPAAPSEACNGLDDTCNGQIDEGFRNQTTGQYDQDTTCGSCAVDCTTLYDLPNASGSCVVSGSPACVLTCDSQSYDLDAAVANGCEFLLDPQAIYVSTADGTDDGTCGLGPIGIPTAGDHPCKTIAFGNTRVVATSRLRVLVANGIYPEAVALVNGKALMGGYAPDNWVRDVAATGTLIVGVSSVGNHDRTVTATSITATTLFDGFVVYGSVNAKTAPSGKGGNSYAIYITGSNGSLTISHNVVFAGRGGPGTDGTSGTDGLQGVNGIGRSSNPNAYDAKDSNGSPCTETRAPPPSNGGALSCGGDDVSGGSGGGNRCAPMETCSGCGANGCTSCTTSDAGADEYSGIDGSAGQSGNPGGGGGTGADAGDDSVLVSAGCYISNPDPTYGRDGSDGANAGHGASGAGCTATGGSVVSGDWAGGTASLGLAGVNGGGGGGGGAGGGSHSQVGGQSDKLGGVGGGGGSGACGGTGGVGAGAGGGAFAIFVVGTAGQVPLINDNSLYRGEGGRGGIGGPGGIGGAGGIGAAGGLSGVFCSDVAGRGGNGGDGGHGAGGGGGCGGSSYGIYTSGVGLSPNYCQGAQNNAISVGGGGAGGAGGYSLINQGGAGTTPVPVTCSFNP